MKRLLVLTGATASGKTALALAWAQRFGGEVINADSRQIYREMDIGTAKPGPADRATVAHHLLDIARPDEAFNLAQYQAAAYAAIEDVQARGRLPLLVGGTGLYITAVLEGWKIPEVPPDPALRAELEALSTDQLFARLQAVDPRTAATIDARNPRRLVRALEVALLTGRSFSELRQKQPPPYTVLPFMLDMPRDQLYARADRRIQQMLAAGWLEETATLLARYDSQLPAMTALGYPQLAAHLRGELSLEDALAQIQRATRQFIRRQYTWVRGHGGESFHWISPEDEASPQIAAWLDA